MRYWILASLLSAPVGWFYSQSQPYSPQPVLIYDNGYYGYAQMQNGSGYQWIDSGNLLYVEPIQPYRYAPYQPVQYQPAFQPLYPQGF